MGSNLVKAYPGRFNKDFENNKKVLLELKLVDDKSVRNQVAGYIKSILEENN